MPLDEDDEQARAVSPAAVADPPRLGQFLFSLRGRVSRSQFWLGWFAWVLAIHLALWLGIAAGVLTESEVIAGTFLLLWVLFWLVTLWPSTAVLVKRIHDRDKTGWLVLAYYVPLVLQFVLSPGDDARASRSIVSMILSALIVATAIWFFIEFGCLRGTVGANRYGPNPAAAS